jgi:hypothetical protein
MLKHGVTFNIMAGPLAIRPFSPCVGASSLKAQVPSVDAIAVGEAEILVHGDSFQVSPSVYVAAAVLRPLLLQLHLWPRSSEPLTQQSNTVAVFLYSEALLGLFQQSMVSPRKILNISIKLHGVNTGRKGPCGATFCHHVTLHAMLGQHVIHLHMLLGSEHAVAKQDMVPS